MVDYPDAAFAQLRATARNAGITDLDDYSTPDGQRRTLLLTDYLSSSRVRARCVDFVAAIAHGRATGKSARLARRRGRCLWSNINSEIPGDAQVRSILMLAAVFVVLLPNPLWFAVPAGDCSGS